MSLKILQIKDKRLSPKMINEYGVVCGGKEMTTRTFQSNSYNTSQVVTVCNPSNRDSVTDLHIYQDLNITLTIVPNGGVGGCSGVVFVNGVAQNPSEPITNAVLSTTNTSGANSQAAVVINNYDCIRAYPISQMVKTLTVDVANDTFKTGLSDYSSILQRFDDTFAEESSQSGEPTMSDYFQTFKLAEASNRNPFSVYGDNSYQDTRNSFPINIITNNSTIAVVNFTISEPIMMSPFLFQKDSHAVGLTDVDTLTITDVFANNFNRCWCHDPTSPTGAVTISSVLNGAFARLTFIKPQQNMPKLPIYTFPYYEPKYYTTSITTGNTNNVLNPGQSLVATSNNMQLSSIPNKIYIYARQLDANLDFTQPDVFSSIYYMNFIWDGRAGVFSELKQKDLYNLSVKNGYCSTFAQWAGQQNQHGAVFCCIPGIDFPLAEDECPGLIGSYNFQFDIGITNISPLPITYQLNIVAVSEGYVKVDHGNVSHRLGFLSKQDVMRAEPSDLTYEYSTLVIGGSLWDTLKNWGKSAFNAVRKAIDSGALNKVASFLPPQYQAGVQSALTGAQQLSNYGHQHGYGPTGGEILAAGNTGGAYIGGKKLSKAKAKMMALGY